MDNLPKSKPKISKEELLNKISKIGDIDRIKYPLIVIGVRGYYEHTMGDEEKNDIGIYDDAIFIDSTNVFASFNGNTDPSKEEIGMANLLPGIYYAHCFGMHKNKYLALVQHKGEVTVERYQGEGKAPKQDKGFFGINIHKGSFNTTSSEGCQTIHPSQYETFIGLATGEAKRIFTPSGYDKVTIPYVLLDFSSENEIV